jgi:L-aspartate oxidase
LSDVKTCAIISNNVCKKANIHKNKKRQCFYTGSEIKMRTDIIIVGSGCAGMYCALNLPKNKDILIITKDIVEHSDSFLAQGGMCMLKDKEDFDSYFYDTMKAGHFENDTAAVETMINSSPDLVKDLLSYGVDFARDEDGNLAYTREGAHARNRILYHEDITGKEITSHIYEQCKKRDNITIKEHWTMVDIIPKTEKGKEQNECLGIVVKKDDGTLDTIYADYTVLASGGIGGIYRYSTNYRHLTGDAVAVSIRHNIELKDIDYVQIHPTTFYSEKEEDRSFLISESVRGEGAQLFDKDKERFTNELLPRDILTGKIKEQMKKDGTNHVWLSMKPIDEEQLTNHFPNIVKHCKEHGYNVPKEMIPVVPAQHYFMGGIKVNLQSKTSMDRLYAVGETACNGVHGRNRLASNSLLESMVFAKRAAVEMSEQFNDREFDRNEETVDFDKYKDLHAWNKENKQMILDLIEESKKQREKADA